MTHAKQTARKSRGGAAPRKQLAQIVQRQNALKNRKGRRAAAKTQAASRSPSQQSEKSSSEQQSQSIVVEERQDKVEERKDKVEERKDKAEAQNFVLKFDDQEQCELDAIAVPTENDIPHCQKCGAMVHDRVRLLDQAAYDELRTREEKVDVPDELKQQLRELDAGIVIPEEQLLWICEFCENFNYFSVHFQLPKSASVCYELCQATAVESALSDNLTLIFCIDISGSMDEVVTQNKIENKKPLSRLDLVKEAIIDELAKLRHERGARRSANVKVGLVTFGSDVKLMGDCTEGVDEFLIPQNLKNNYEGIVEVTDKQCDRVLSGSLQTAFDDLKITVRGLSCYGGTALGAGLVAALAMARRGGAGSKVIICTDGEANEGLGSANAGGGEDRVVEFYERVALEAVASGVSISVFTIRGDQGCKIKHLGRLANQTNGFVSRVDPTLIGSEFRKVIDDEILGTNAHITIRLNRAFCFRDQGVQYISDNQSLLKKEHGNFSKDTEITYNFRMRQPEEVVGKTDISLRLFERKALPMQIQLRYVSKKRAGKIFVSTFTDWREMGAQEEEVLKEMDFATWATTRHQQIANLAKQKDYNKGLQLAIQSEEFALVHFKDKEEQQQGLKQFIAKNQNLKEVLKSKLNKESAQSSASKNPTALSLQQKYQDEDEDSSDSVSESESSSSSSSSRSRTSGSERKSKSRSRSRSVEQKKRVTTSLQQKNTRVKSSNQYKKAKKKSSVKKSAPVIKRKQTLGKKQAQAQPAEPILRSDSEDEIIYKTCKVKSSAYGEQSQQI